MDSVFSFNLGERWPVVFYCLVEKIPVRTIGQRTFEAVRTATLGQTYHAAPVEHASAQR